MTEERNVTRNNVYYWEAILNTEIAKATPVLEQKQKRLMWLRNLPFEQQSEANYKAIRLLEEEFSVILGIIGAVEMLRDSYIDTTAAMAESYQVLYVESESYRQKLTEIVQKRGEI
jgi:hypothetical protein